MKSSSLSTKLIFAALAFTALAYFGVQAYCSLAGGYTTVLTYTYRTEDSVTVSGFVVRDETVLASDEPLLEPTRSEGERVSRGGVVANAYKSEAALQNARELDALNERLAQLEEARLASDDMDSALRLDEEVSDGIAALRGALSANGGISTETQSAALRTSVLKRAYAFRDAGELDQRIAALKQQIAENNAAAERTRIRAPFAGTYSAVVDGYEDVLRPGELEALTPSALSAVQPQSTQSAAGKLIAGETWYFATVVDEATAERARACDTLTLRFARGMERDLTMTVAHVSEAEDGQAVLVLSCRKYLSEVTLLREQSADLIFTAYEGLRVPNAALHIDENGGIGVFCRVGLTAYCKPVEVIYRGEDYCLVSPVKVDSTRESTIQLYTLRVGDELILTAEELYDGKIIG